MYMFMEFLNSTAYQDSLGHVQKPWQLSRRSAAKEATAATIDCAAFLLF